MFTLIGIVCSFASTFFAHGFLSLARSAINQGKAVKRSFLVQNLVRSGRARARAPVMHALAPCRMARQAGGRAPGCSRHTRPFLA